MTTTVLTIGERLRDWRRKRRLSQLDLACEAEISTRHLSFLETGRAAPSRDMVLRLAEGLGVPLRERNALLLAAGFAPVLSGAAFGLLRWRLSSASFTKRPSSALISVTFSLSISTSGTMPSA